MTSWSTRPVRGSLCGVALVLCTAGCGLSDQAAPNPVGPSSSSGIAQPSPRPATPVPAPAPAPEPPTPPSPGPEPVTGLVLHRLLTTAIEEEYRTGTIYAAVVADYGPVSPFLESAARQSGHAATIGPLFETRGWPVPANDWTLEGVVHFRNVPEACAGASVAELRIASMYGGYLDDYNLPRDVRVTFGELREASLTKDLPSFVACAP